MARTNNAKNCDGCIHNDGPNASNILVHMQFCLRCKRAYWKPEDRDIHVDFYKTKGDFDEEID